MRRITVLLPTLLVADLAFANGLEAPTTASARYAAIGSAAASSVVGPDALLLNPAGLSRAKGFEITLNAMPILNQTVAPLNGPNQSRYAEKGIVPLGELLASYQLLPGLGIGAGVNLAGGLGASFGAIDFGGYAMDPEVSQLLGSLEASIGAGYQLSSTFSVGAAWRFSYVTGEMRTAGVLPNGMLQAMAISSASGTAFDGFRIGAQWRSEDDRFGLGASVRTPVEWKMKGTASVMMVTPDGASPEMPLGDVSMRLVFPLQAAIGGDLRLSSALQVFAQYSFSNYSVNETQDMEMGGQQLSSKLAWNDRHTAQFGAEYMLGDSWAVRAGYVFESRIVPEDRPTLYTPPSAAHTVGIGTGTDLGASLRLDGGLFYNWSSGAALPAADALAFPGEYSQDNFVASISASYRI